MAADSIVMKILGLSVTWGGAALCIYIALRKRGI
jgi:hypothetical protein